MLAWAIILSYYFLAAFFSKWVLDLIPGMEPWVSVYLKELNWFFDFGLFWLVLCLISTTRIWSTAEKSVRKIYPAKDADAQYLTSMYAKINPNADSFTFYLCNEPWLRQECIAPNIILLSRSVLDLPEDFLRISLLHMDVRLSRGDYVRRNIIICSREVYKITCYPIKFVGIVLYAFSKIRIFKLLALAPYVLDSIINGINYIMLKLEEYNNAMEVYRADQYLLANGYEGVLEELLRYIIDFDSTIDAGMTSINSRLKRVKGESNLPISFRKILRVIKT